MDAIIIAKIYNEMAGASITHKEIEEWGWMEVSEIEYALKFVGKL